MLIVIKFWRAVATDRDIKMNTTKMLPLVAVMTGLLAGCGESSSGGGGGAPAKTTIDLEFVKVEEKDASTVASCKFYDRTRTVIENNGIEDITTKALIAKPIEDSLNSLLSIVYSDADGELQSSSQEFVNDGVVTVVIDDIPDGGYLNIREQVGFDVYVTSYSKELLEANADSMSKMLLTAVSPIPSLSCTTGSNLTEITKNGIRYLNTTDNTSGDSAVFPYHFTSDLESETSNNPEVVTNTDFQALNTDITLITQYRADNSLFQYGFEDWNSGSIEMSYTGSSETISRPSSVIYNDLEIGVVYKDTDKVLMTVPNSTNTYYHTSTLRDGEQWFAKTEGTPVASWAAVLNVPMDDTWALSVDESDLFNTSTLADVDANLSNQANNALVVDLTNSITIGSVDNGVQRITLKPNSNSVDTQLHTIYSFTQDSVIVPKIEVIDASDLTTYSLQQNYWFTESDEDLDIRFVLDGFNTTALSDSAYDPHGLILDESKRVEIKAQSKSTKFISVQRAQ